MGSADVLNCDRKLYVSKVAIVSGVFSQDALISPALFFCPTSEHIQTVNILIFAAFLWGNVGLHFTQN